MARENITFLVNVRQNENQNSAYFGKYYGEAETHEPLSLKGFAAHLASHGKLASYEMMVLVLQSVVSCMKELILQGQSVKLEGLGTFYPTLETKPANSVKDFTVANIKGVHLRFLPEGVKGDSLTSRALRDECHFELHDLVKTHTKLIDGKKRTYQERIPLSSYDVQQATADDNEESPIARP